MSEDKPLPLFSSDDDAEAFVGSADLTGYDLSALTPTRFEFSSKDARVNMRLPSELLDAVKATAARKGVPYQRFIRQALEQALHG
jgi:predicted DNA binding CopG/RHH family protein